MTYKEIGYIREHHKKHHPKEADILSKSLLGVAGMGARNQQQHHTRQ